MRIQHYLLIFLVAVLANGCRSVYLEEDTPPGPPITLEQRPDTGVQSDWQPVTRPGLPPEPTK